MNGTETPSTAVKPIPEISKEAVAPLQSARHSNGRKHYEFYGDLVSKVVFARIIVLILCLIIFGLLFTVVKLVNKPSMVFRTTKSGNTKTYTPSNPDSVFNEELVFLTMKFVTNHNDLNPATVEESLEKALSLCLSSSRNELLKELSNDKNIEVARTRRPTYHIEVGKIKIRHRSHPHYKTYCIVNLSFLKPRQFLRVHVYEITWKKLDRTDANPFGLYISKLDHYNQNEIHNRLN